ncbi:MAG: PRC-barrel domain-containing protein, partial [Chloroflexota bacterium]
QGPVTTANWQISEGMTVYATDGTKLGTVRNYNPQAGYLDVRKGWLFTKDFYVPTSAVDAVAEDGLTLTLAKDDLDDARYGSPPVAGGGTAMSSDVPLMGGEKQPIIGEDSDVLDRTGQGSLTNR